MMDKMREAHKALDKLGNAANRGGMPSARVLELCRVVAAALSQQAESAESAKDPHRKCLTCGYPAVVGPQFCRGGVEHEYTRPQPAVPDEQVKAEAVREFCKEIGLFDSAYDDQGYIEVSRHSLKEYIAMLAATPDAPVTDCGTKLENPQGNVHDELTFVGYTNGAQILYANDPNFDGEGQFYIDTDHNCVIPLYMLKTHLHRLESTTDGEVTLDRIKGLQCVDSPETAA